MSVSSKHAHFYAAYLNSPEWRKKRDGALSVAGYKCQRCGEQENLQVHHLTYDRLGDELSEDLRVLCEPCHADEHGRISKNDRTVIFLELKKRRSKDAQEVREQERTIVWTLLCQLEDNIDALRKGSLERAPEIRHKHFLQALDDLQAALDRTLLAMNAKKHDEVEWLEDSPRAGIW